MFNKSFLTLALFHLIVPAVSVVLFGASPLWLFGNLVFAAAVIKGLNETDSVYIVALLCLLSGAAFALNLMLGTCYYMQGEGFNDAFFFHLHTDTLVIAARGYSQVFYPSLLGLALAFLAPAIIFTTSTQKILPRIPVLFLWVLALAGNYPIYQLASYQFSLAANSNLSGLERTNDQKLTGDRANTALSQTGVDSAISKSKKNIILIYAESLEELYFDREIFGDLLPNIRKLSANAQRFTNLVQVDGTGWTLSGIIASQCGFPLRVSNNLASNSTMASIEKPYPNKTCLVDILSESGYETVYLGGAPLWFAGKENFLRTHGYKRMAGYEDLIQVLPDDKYYSGWGVYDDSLFEFALDELQSLQQGDQPYLLTLLTLDTHHPKGLPSKSCEELPDNTNPMSNSIYCSDQLISNFINQAMKIVNMSNTIIVLFSDHLSMRNTLWDELKDNEERRRLMFMIFDDTPAAVANVHGTHFDVAPTVLEAAGFTGQLRVGAGVSLFSLPSEKPGVEQIAHEEGSTPTLLSSDSSVKDSGVVISRNDLSLSIGNLTVKANNKGNKFRSGIFLAVLDDKGSVVDTAYSDSFPKLVKHLEGSFVIGIAVMPRPPYTAKYFFGTITPDGREITEHYLDQDVHLDANDLWPSQD